MDVEPDIARTARTIGDPTRIRMLMLLMDGRALTAKELAYGSGVTPATGTTHLRKMVAEALVVVRSQGRHKYFRLASPDVGRCVESLLVISTPAKPVTGPKHHPLRQARLCYDHLAGEVGTQITQVLLKRRLLVAHGREFVVTPKGEDWFGRLGVDVSAAKRTRRSFAHACLDWSERKDHLAGALGAALAKRLFESGWLKAKPGSRIVSVTDSGRHALATHFGVRTD